ncbi:MAG: leucine-rich repeat domain-containing protein [Mycoplasma sp.]|nr:leucine-rich repeat domain-containing protein [Mycoplasma sp.]
MKKLLYLLPISTLPLISLTTVSCSSGDWNAGIPEPTSDVWMIDTRTPFQFNVYGEVRLYTALTDEEANNLVIPEVLEHNHPTIAHAHNGYKVKSRSIASDFFGPDGGYGRDRLKSISLPNSIEVIDGLKNTNITKIIIPSSTHNIRQYTFSGCKLLKNVFFQEGSQLKYIYQGAFYDIALEGHLDLSKLEFLDRIDSFAFQNTKLTSVNLPPKCRYDYTAFPAGCQVIGGEEYGRPSASEK